MIRLLFVSLALTSCSLIISEPPSGPDAGAGEPPALSCAEGERADEIGRVCVPMTGTRTCEAGASVDAEHAWLKEASAVLYAAPQAAGDGSGSDAGNAGSLEAMVAAAGAEATAVLLAPGTYSLSDPLALAVRGPLSLVGPCAAQVTVELGAPMTTSGSVQLYGLAVRGPLSAEEGASNSAIIVSGSGTFKLVQSTVSAPAGHGVELTGAGSDAAVISGVTFGAVRDSALHALGALGSWTVTGNLSKGPIGAHGLSITGGDAALTISSNRFEAISGDALRASDALGSWTVTGNLSKGPIGGDGISIAGGLSLIHI